MMGEEASGVWGLREMGVFRDHRVFRLKGKSSWAAVSLPTGLHTLLQHSGREMDTLGCGFLLLPDLLSGVESATLSFLEGKDLRTLCPPQTPQVPKSTEVCLTACHPGTKCFIRVQFLSAPRRKREGKIERGEPGPDPRPLPPWEPRADALLGQGRLCEIPEGPRRSGLEAAEEGWGGGGHSKSQAEALSLDLTLCCSTPLWVASTDHLPTKSREGSVPWGRPRSAYYPIPVTLCCHLAHVPDTGHTGTPGLARSSDCVAFSHSSQALLPSAPSLSHLL